MKEHFGNTAMGFLCGLAAIILAITLGIGGCAHLIDSAAKQEPKESNL